MKIVNKTKTLKAQKNNKQSIITFDKSTRQQHKNQQLTSSPFVIDTQVSRKVTKNNYKKVSNLWTNNATGFVRAKSPSHKIPQAPRLLSSTKVNKKNSIPSCLQLDLTPKSMCKNVIFSKSKRQKLFTSPQQQYNSSPASYYNPRFMDQSYYKRNLQLQQMKVSILTQNKDTNFQQSRSMFTKVSSISSASDNNKIKGRTIGRFKHYQKQYKSYAKNMPYQPQFTAQYPSIGSYNLQHKFAAQKPSYSMRLVLNRFFDEQIKKSHGKGPAGYNINRNQPRKQSYNQKTTIQKSQRTYLRKPLNDFPGPSKYHIRRYLQYNK